MCSKAVQNVLSGCPVRDKANGNNGNNGNNGTVAGKSDKASAQGLSKEMSAADGKTWETGKGSPESARVCPKWFCCISARFGRPSQSSQSSQNSQLMKTVEWSRCPKCTVAVSRICSRTVQNVDQ